MYDLEETDWSKYSCLSITAAERDVNSFIQEDLREHHAECLLQTCTYYNVIFNRIEFSYSGNFWIDELYIARQVVVGEHLHYT